MAYTQGTVTKTPGPGRTAEDRFVYAWSDSGVDSGSEAVIENVPRQGCIVRYKATLTGGSGSTINPRIGRTAGFSANTQDQVVAAPGAAAFIDQTGPFYYSSSTGKLYINITPDSGTDNAVAHELLIVNGWPV